MGYKGLTAQPLQHVPQHLFEIRCVSQVPPANSMYAGCAEISIHAQKRRPGIDRLSGRIDVDDRHLDDPVMSPGMYARGLAIDNRI